MLNMHKHVHGEKQTSNTNRTSFVYEASQFQSLIPKYGSR